MADTAQIEVLERSKRRAVLVLCLTAVALLVVSALRFVARLNDALSGKPDYVRILTETFGRQLASQTQMQFPVIVEQDEHGTCQAVSAPSIAEEEIRGTIYLLTYSEQQTLTCITTYVVPTDASRASTLRDFGPAEGRNYGPALLGTVKGIAEYRIARVYAPEYLRRLHWRLLAIHAALSLVAERGSEPEKPSLLFRRHTTSRLGQYRFRLWRASG